MPKVKEFRLKEGAEHHHDGQAVAPRDKVLLTESQARSFRDKFDPIDESEFKEVDEVEPYRRSEPEKTDLEKQKPSEEAPQGQAVPQPPIHVGGPANEGPADPTVLDPSRQGQQSREQRELIDSGRIPPAATMLQTEEQKKKMVGESSQKDADTGAKTSGGAPNAAAAGASAGKSGSGGTATTGAAASAGKAETEKK